MPGCNPAGQKETGRKLRAAAHSAPWPPQQPLDQKGWARGHQAQTTCPKVAAAFLRIVSTSFAPFSQNVTQKGTPKRGPVEAHPLHSRLFLAPDNWGGGLQHLSCPMFWTVVRAFAWGRAGWSRTGDGVASHVRANGPLNWVLPTGRDGINLEASDGLCLGAPRNGDGPLCDICHTWPARRTDVCRREATVFTHSHKTKGSRKDPRKDSPA